MVTLRATDTEASAFIVPRVSQSTQLVPTDRRWAPAPRCSAAKRVAVSINLFTAVLVLRKVVLGDKLVVFLG